MAPAHKEVFVLTITRRDGSPFVSSVGERSEVRSVARQLGFKEAIVSHWKRCGRDETGYRHPMDGWELQERYAL